MTLTLQVFVPNAMGIEVDMEETFDDKLKENLKDPEFVAHFANAQVETARELLKCGIITSLDSTSLSNKSKRLK